MRTLSRDTVELEGLFPSHGWEILGRPQVNATIDSPVGSLSQVPHAYETSRQMQPRPGGVTAAKTEVNVLSMVDHECQQNEYTESSHPRALCGRA